MLQRNHFVARGYGQSSWRSMEGLKAKFAQGVFAKQQLQKSLMILCCVSSKDWLACHPAQNPSTLEFDTSCCLAGKEPHGPAQILL